MRPPIHLQNLLSLYSGSLECAGASPNCQRVKARYSLDQSPVHRRAMQKDEQTCTHFTLTERERVALSDHRLDEFVGGFKVLVI